jgi:transposase, IS30 family
MKEYTQLAIEQRYQIYAFRKAGKTLEAIGKEIGYSESTVSRELKRNKGARGYRPDQANQLAKSRKSKSEKFVKMTKKLKAIIEQSIRKDWSPEQVSGYLRIYKDIKISHERIYQHILEDKKNGGNLYKHLRTKSKRYKKRYGSTDRRGAIKNRKSIDERPKIVDEKSRIGDWEVDTVIGKNHKGALVTIVERVTKLTLIAHVPQKTAECVGLAMIKLLLPFKNSVCTITSDNGKEFAYHEQVSEIINSDFYFAHPYSSWERGLNENTNGLIRQYLPKKSCMKEISQENVNSIMEKLNSRPRKALNFDTPLNYFYNNFRS